MNVFFELYNFKGEKVFIKINKIEIIGLFVMSISYDCYLNFESVENYLGQGCMTEMIEDVNDFQKLTEKVKHHFEKSDLYKEEPGQITPIVLD